MFYKSIGIDLTMSNYLILFSNQERFIKKYGLSNKELIKRFNYSEYLNNKELNVRKKEC